MSLNEDAWRGIWLGAGAMFLVWFLLSMGSCARPQIMEYPTEHKQCVVRFNVIEHCYPKERQ